ncbi:MAG: Helicase domain protein [Actinobacteria bacterium 66_15]|nr:MAG: Helicase domain protein [Actinobacteria bacterium 66_15]
MSRSTHYSSLNPQTFSEGDWVFVHPQKTLGRIIEKSCLWGNTSFRVWLPSSNSIIRVDASALSPAQSSVLSPHHLSYIAAAARVADALTQDVLLAPIESSVIPLPHQIRALSRATANDRVRYLLADEVGLGKTIERIGLPQVRNYRLNLLAQEARSFQEQMEHRAQAYPEMVPLLLIRVEGGA